MKLLRNVGNPVLLKGFLRDDGGEGLEPQLAVLVFAPLGFDRTDIMFKRSVRPGSVIILAGSGNCDRHDFLFVPCELSTALDGGIETEFGFQEALV